MSPRPANSLPRKRRLRMLGRLLSAFAGSRVAATRPAFSAANLPRLRGRLEFVRDERGVPHLYAEEEPDLYVALGYLQAADRFFLLDALRHVGAGRLCEWVGNLRLPRNELLPGRSVFDIDQFLRPLGFEGEAARDAPRLAPEARACLEGFSEGVNAALRAMKGVYPAEYLFVGRVRPWRVEDSLLATRASAFTVTLINLENELTFDAVRAHLGDEGARRLYPEVPWEHAPTSYEARGAAPPEAPLHVPSAGSNNWAVAGGRSAAGAPLVANDPHVPLLPLPTYWYHAHLECPAYRVQGGVFPGVPAFGFGHNGELAWGCTTGFRDAWDLVRIHREAGDRSLYRTPEGTARIVGHTAPHQVRFRRPLRMEWESCDHGVLYPGWTHHDGTDLAVRYVSCDLAAWFEGYRGFAASKTVDDFRRALERANEGPFDFNIVYGHRDGHIGWELIGRLPRRKRDGLFCRDAQDPDAAWEGVWPFAEMPKILNPESGIVATANSWVDPARSHVVATLGHFEPRYRHDRIEASLADRSDHSAETFTALQGDIGSDYGPPLRDALLDLLGAVSGDRATRAVELLRRWEGDFPQDSWAAPIFFFTQKELVKQVFTAVLGAEVGARFTAGRRAVPRLHKLLLDPTDPLRGDVERGAGRSLAELAAESLEAGLDRIAAICGPAEDRQVWGRIQRARLGTLLGEIPRLGRRFLALDAPFPGDDYTVNPSRSLDEGHRVRAFVAASSRFVCDLARPEEALFAHSSGPSGDVGSAFHANLSAPWQRFEYFRSALWKPEEVPDAIERAEL